jgi:hypothetical protein
MKRGFKFKRILGGVPRGRVGFSPAERRRPLTRARWLLLAGIVPLALAAMMAVFPAAAGADSTIGFHVYDWTQYPIQLNSVQTNGGSSFDGTPAMGSVLQPGQYGDFEFVYRFLQDSTAQVWYKILGPDDLVGIGMKIDGGYNPSSSCTGGPCDANGSTIKLLDKPGTVVNIPAGQGQQQAQLLNQFCAQDTDAKCDFDLTHEDLIEPNENDLKSLKILYPVVPNKTQDDVDVKVQCENSIDVSDSIGGSIEAGGKLFNIVELKVTVKYNHEITAGAKFSRELTYKVRPGYEGWVVAGASVYRDWGDFTISLANTTWHLQNVYFDSADLTGKQVWEPVTQKLNGGAVTEAPVISQSQAAVAAGAPPVPDECNQV